MTVPSPLPTPTVTLTLSAQIAIKEYAEQCATILQNTPLSIVAHGTRTDFLNYLSDEWSKLVPPPSLTAYHAAVRAYYDEWSTLPEDVNPDPEGQVSKRVVELTFTLDRYTLDTLEATGCIDRNAAR